MLFAPSLLLMLTSWHFQVDCAFAQSFVWMRSGAQQHAQVTLDTSDQVQRAILSFKVSEQLSWTSSVDVSSSDGGRIDSPRPSASAFPARNGARLIHLSAPIPNWAQSVFWLTTESESEPLVFRYRDDFSRVFKISRDNGTVAQLVFYDRWVGGPPSIRTIKGVRVDRWEEVTTYELTGTGFRITGERYRLVPATGGGVQEKLFVWMSRI